MPDFLSIKKLSLKYCQDIMWLQIASQSFAINTQSQCLVRCYIFCSEQCFLKSGIRWQSQTFIATIMWQLTQYYCLPNLQVFWVFFSSCSLLQNLWVSGLRTPHTPVMLFCLAGSLLLYRCRFSACTTTAAGSEVEQLTPHSTLYTEQMGATVLPGTDCVKGNVRSVV